MITAGSLFSGMGGFERGFERAGIQTSWSVEIDLYRQKVLAQHFPNTEIFSDIKECGFRNLKPVDIICGGFPCQDISIAGKGGGLDGARSGLWFEFYRIIRELRPQFAVIENSSILNLRGLNAILCGFAEIGYDAEWTIISAADVGAPHLRERTWIVSYPNADGIRQIQHESEKTSQSRVDAQRRAERLDINVSNTDRARLQSALCAPISSIRESEKSCERGQFSRGITKARTTWPFEPNLGDLANELPTDLASLITFGDIPRDTPIPRTFRGIKNRSKKVEAIGDTLMPDITEAIGRRLVEIMSCPSQ